MLGAIVGIELPPRLVGKWKVSQNRPPADLDGVGCRDSMPAAPRRWRTW
jgi:predicted FMN-binding regulatory protein PaiB